MNKLIFDPLEEYRDHFKQKHHDNVTSFFDDLVTQSGVSLETNDLTVKELKTLETRHKNETKALNKVQTTRTLLIILAVLLAITTIVFIYFAVQGSAAPVPFGVSIAIAIVAPLLMIAVLFYNIRVIRPRIKDASKRIRELLEKIEVKRTEAWAQMHALNALFDATMTPALVEKTIPLLAMDPLFDSRRFDYLHRKYGLAAFTGENESAEFVQSGQIQGNPFLLARSLYMDMGTKTYSGSLVVTYTVTVYVNNKPQTQTRTQTLTATLTKPCPYYSNDTIIIYGNEAAPNLSFNRYPQLPINWTKKSLDQFVAKEKREMEKLADKSLKKGKHFTPLGNLEFEALFNAYNRDHELEYRLLFTALGQSEISDLIKDKTVGFGDNFEFHKTKELNVIRSRHSQKFDYSGDPRMYQHYDNKVIRERFINYNNDYLRYFYFNIAPVLAVPLYQQHKPQEFIYGTDFKSHLSFYEHEATVNHFPQELLAHPESKTQNILKTKVIAKGVDYDTVSITSHGFKTIDRVDYVTKMAGNGSAHRVPVHWVEYIPVEKETNANIKVLDEKVREKVMHGGIFSKMGEYLSKYTNKNTPVTGRHVMAFLLAKNFTSKDNDDLNKFLDDTN